MRGRPYQSDYNGSPLERFLRNCAHDPITGCVLWTGGTTAGRGHSARYGAFWFEGRRWSAHRWAAEHIHGQDIDGLQVDHCCPPFRAGDLWLPPNTLCVEHVQPLTLLENRALQTERRPPIWQSIDERRHWAHIQCGLTEPPPHIDEVDVAGVPYYPQPTWLREMAI